MTRYITSTDRYIKHPAVADSELRDGSPLDAESAMIVHNNLSVLSKRNVRLIGHDPGPGEFIGYDWTDKGNSPYDGIFDASPPEFGGTIDPWDRIPWTPEFCAHFGPYNGVGTRVSIAPPGYMIRSVRVRVVGSGGTPAENTLCWIGAALVQGSLPPRSSNNNVIARATFQVFNDPATAFDENLDLIPSLPVRPNSEWIARATGGAVPVSVSVPALHVWVGWWSTNTDTGEPEWVSSISAFEVYT